MSILLNYKNVKSVQEEEKLESVNFDFVMIIIKNILIMGENVKEEKFVVGHFSL